MTRDIFEGHDPDHAQFIRDCCASLGHELPASWTDEQVIGFFNTLSEDVPRIYTDQEKADMKYDAQVMS